MIPTLAGLVLAVPLSALSGSAAGDRCLRALRLLRIPEERDPPPLMRRREELETALRDRVGPLTLPALLRDHRLSSRHFAVATPPPPSPRGTPDLARAAAALKISDAQHRDEALEWLSGQERMAVLCHGELFAALAGSKSADGSPAGHPG
jgi:membrane glycosyltransferase